MSLFARLSISIIAFVGLLDVFWMSFAGFGFEWGELAKTLICVGILLSISCFYTVFRPVEDFAVVTLWTAILVSFSVVAAINSYLFASLGFSLTDSYFAAFDRAIGFDWLATLSFVNQYPLIGKLSTFFYLSSLPLVAMTLIYLSFTGRGKQLELFITSLIISCIITLFVSGPLAALGPYVYYNPPIELYRDFAPAVMPQGADSPYISHLMALRDGSMRLLSLGHTEGLIVFPSFHTVMSVLMILALRGCGPMFWLGGVFNILVLMTVPIDGGHYLADMVAGLLVAIVVWVGLFKMQKNIAYERGEQRVSLPRPVLACREN